MIWWISTSGSAQARSRSVAGVYGIQAYSSKADPPPAAAAGRWPQTCSSSHLPGHEPQPAAPVHRLRRRRRIPDRRAPGPFLHGRRVGRGRATPRASDRAPHPLPVSCGTSQPAGSAPCAHVSLPCSAPWHPFEFDDRLSCGYVGRIRPRGAAGRGESARGQSVSRPVRACAVRRAGVPGGQDDLERANTDYSLDASRSRRVGWSA